MNTGAKKTALRDRQTAPRKQTGTRSPPGGLIAIPGAIPARCPVTNRADWCMRSDCRHWSDGCSHPRGHATEAEAAPVIALLLIVAAGVLVWWLAQQIRDRKPTRPSGAAPRLPRWAPQAGVVSHHAGARRRPAHGPPADRSDDLIIDDSGYFTACRVDDLLSAGKPRGFLAA